MQDGEFDSSGTFTVDRMRALQKMGQYQAEAAGFWLVKLLQAAVRLGSSHFTVRQSGDETSASFTSELPIPVLVGALTSLEPAGEPALSHLQMGAQALSSIPHCKCAVLFQSSANEYRFALNDGVLFAPGDPPMDLSKHTVVFLRQRTRRSGLLARERSTMYADEALFLQEVGRFAPIEIRLNRRLLNDPLANKPPGLRLGVPVPSLGRRPWPAIPYTSLERIVLTSAPEREQMALLNHSVRVPSRRMVMGKGEKRSGQQAYCQQWTQQERNGTPGMVQAPRTVYGTFDSRIERNDQEFQIWYDWNRGLPSILVRGYLSIDLAPREGRLYLIKDGVAMKPKLLDGPLAGTLTLWSEPRVNTDLSQLQVLEDDLYSEVLESVKQQYVAAARELLAMERELPRRMFENLLHWKWSEATEWAQKFLNSCGLRYVAEDDEDERTRR